MCDIVPHVTNLVVLLHTTSTAGNPTLREPLISIGDIAAIAEFATPADAILMARDEIGYLDDLSLDGDMPDGVCDIGEDEEKAVFT